MHTDLSPNPLANWVHTAFYRFVPIVPESVVEVLREITPPLLGSVLVAAEGVNGVLAGEASAVQAFEARLGSDPRLQGWFSGLAFRHSACRTQPFHRLKVHHRKHLVAFDVPWDAPAQADARSGVLDAVAWRTLLARDDVLVLDNRNGFEYSLGHFHGAVNPEVAHFRSFEDYVRSQAQAWRADGRKVAMYCTGGIRCERAAPWMQSLGLEVFQLQGGILGYFEALPDAERDWQGECFVFDNRIALNTRLQQTRTTAEQVYQNDPQGAWRLRRAQRLAAADAAAPVPTDTGETTCSTSSNPRPPAT